MSRATALAAAAAVAVLLVAAVGAVAGPPAWLHSSAASGAGGPASPRLAPPAGASDGAPGGDAAVIAENALHGDASWRRAVARSDDPAAMSGYADRSAADPGDQVAVFVSTTAPSFRVLAYRMGWYAGTGGRKVWASSDLPGVVQTAQGYLPDTRTPYAQWQPSTTIDTTGWPPGMYLLRLVGSAASGGAGPEWLVPLVMRSPDPAGRIVYLMSDLTWQAYNRWGGRSAYKGPGGFSDRSRAVSFSRPYLNGHGTGNYLGYEHPAVSLAERLGIPVSYVAASDLAVAGRAEADTALAGAQGIVSLGHDEYWTPRERDAVTAARDAGVDLAFLGANAMYWRSRLEPGPQGLPLEVIYKSAAQDPVSGRETTARWRDAPMPEGERSLVGMDYECFPAKGTYVVADPGFFLFAGTDTTTGYEDLVGIEVDRAYPLPGTPDTLQVVANSPTTCNTATTVSNSTYYTTASGAGVFAVGTMGWLHTALRRSAPPATYRFVETITTTLLFQMLAGPMGQAHPAQPNIGDFDLGSTNTTGAV